MNRSGTMKITDNIKISTAVPPPCEHYFVSLLT